VACASAIADTVTAAKTKTARDTIIRLNDMSFSEIRTARAEQLRDSGHRHPALAGHGRRSRRCL
jgi:hypothetical protein